jgi:imidazolonepropionase-like amidohydrolase
MNVWKLNVCKRSRRDGRGSLSASGSGTDPGRCVGASQLRSTPVRLPARPWKTGGSIAAAWFSAICLSTLTSLASAQVAVKGGVVHTMSGENIVGGVVVITDGKIAAVGTASNVRIPDGYRVLEAAVVTPGLVDPRGTVGLSGLYNSRHDSDQLERSGAVQPELRALDAYNPLDRLVQWVREFGVTTVHTGHAPGELVSGQTIVVKTTGTTVEQALVKSPAMVAATLGPGSLEGDGKAPGTRAKQVAMLREELIRAREFIEKRRRAAEKNDPAKKDAADAAQGDASNAAESGGATAPDRNLRLELLADVLAGQVPLLVTANRAQDIESAIRLKDEFGFRLVLDSAAEAYLLTDRIKATGVDVILHPSMQRAVGEAENQSFETAAALAKAGVRFAIESGYESYVPKARVILFEAAIAAANGLTFDQALASITIDAARIVGVENRVGSIEIGKDGDLALYDGDPFEYATRCVGVVIEGAVVSETPR